MNFGEASTSFVEGADFMHVPSTVCLDVHDGSADVPPYWIVWMEGQDGANCDDPESLTLESAAFLELSHGGTRGSVDKTMPVFFRQTALQSAAVTVTGKTMLSPEAAALGLSCTTAWQPNTDYQALCTPLAGAARHVRIEDATSITNSHYFYLVLGDSSDTPTGTPTVADDSGTFVMTAGRNHLMASATSFRFNSNIQTSQYDFGLYTPGPSTFCLDLGGDDSENLQLVMWATGAGGADCADFSTLRAENALYSSATDDAAMWNAPLASGYNYIKTSNVGATLGNVVVSSERARDVLIRSAGGLVTGDSPSAP